MTTDQRVNTFPMPDWKSSESYPKGEQISMRQWAWEFLRRNPKYQADWSDYCKKWREVTPDWDPGRPFPDDQKQADAILAAEDDERLWVEEQRKGGGVRKTPLDRWYGQRHGLGNFPNPFIANPPITQRPEFDTAPKATEVINPGDKYNESPMRSRFVLMEFDLSLPLDMQLEAVARVLKNRQNRLIKEGTIPALTNSRKRGSMYPIYLRALDAKAAKATKVKMAEVFSLERADGVTEKDIKNWINAAEKLATEGYEQLVKLAN